MNSELALAWLRLLIRVYRAELKLDIKQLAGIAHCLSFYTSHSKAQSEPRTCSIETVYLTLYVCIIGTNSTLQPRCNDVCSEHSHRGKHTVLSPVHSGKLFVLRYSTQASVNMNETSRVCTHHVFCSL